MKKNKNEIATTLQSSYGDFSTFIQGLADAHYEAADSGKWSARQQLEHLIVCVKPLEKVFGLGPKAWAQNFAGGAGESREFDTMESVYKEKLKAGGKAPEKFEPGAEAHASRAELLATLDQTIANLSDSVAKMDESDLDKYQLPHPLLGQITFREMLYNAIQHVGHHQASIAQYLQLPA